MRTRFLLMLLAGLLTDARLETTSPITVAQTATPPQTTAPPPRPTPPTRDPSTPGYVTARELADGAVPAADVDGNFIIGPTHAPAPEMTVRDDVPHGAICELTMSSADSRIYPGIAREPGTFGTVDPNDPAKLVVTTSHPASYTRRVAVYVPKQYVAGSAAPFIVGADGPDQFLFTALDNLIAQKRVPAMVAISISNGSGDAQGSQRGLEYDTMSGRYAEFVETEVLPLVESTCHVKLTKDPEGRATMGTSSGAAAALSMAWYRTDLYHRVLSYSGTYVNQQWPPSAETPHGAWEYHERLIPNSPPKPIRIWMEVGDRDLLNPNVMRDNMHDWVLANEHMARVLAAKGYHYQFLFVRNAGHGDRAVKQQTLPQALEWLWKGYAPARGQSTPDDRLPPSALPAADRPFGTLRDQAAMQQAWLKKRLDTFVPPLMRAHGVDMWVVPMREYNEDPIFSSITAPETFFARRRTIYIFFDKCAAAGTPVSASCVERIALGGTSQGGVFQERRSMKPIAAATGARQAELWGDEQWLALKQVVEERKPKVIAIDRSKTFAFTDGLSSGELQGMSEALGPAWTAKFRDAEELPLDLVASRLPEEEAFFEKMTALVWQMTQTMFSDKVIVPGTTRTSDLVWWWRQRTNDQGLGTWFQPSVSVQRKGVKSDQIGEDPVIQPGDLLHCDVGITVARLNTDTQHNAYVLRPGETDAPAGLKRALANANAMQDFSIDEIRPGRSGNEILGAVLGRMKAKGITGTMYSHPIGMHGHGAGPLIGLWDYQDGVPGRGDAKVVPSMWYSVELQATTPVAEWDNQPVQIAQEEDMIIGADGRRRWALKRQDRLFLVGGK